MFVGYPPTQKGYRLLDLSTMQTFVTRDVTFNEFVFPLNVTTPTPYMLPLPTVMPNPAVNTYIDDDFSPEPIVTDPSQSASTMPTVNTEISSSTHPISVPQIQTSPPRRTLSRFLHNKLLLLLHVS